MPNEHQISDAFLRPKAYARYHWGTWLVSLWAVLITYAFAPSLLAPIFLSVSLSPPSPSETTPIQSLILMTVLYAPTLVLVAFTLAKLTRGSMRRLSQSIGASAALLSALAVLYVFIEQASNTDPKGYLYTPKFYAFALSCYVLTLLGFTVSLFAAQQRLLTSTITASANIRIGLVAISFGAVLALYGISAFGLHITGISPLERLAKSPDFWTFAAISCALIPIQSASEEIVFRGFLNQALARYVRSDWVVFTISSGLFAAIHLGNPEMVEGGMGWYINLFAYFSFGYFCCLLTRRFGGIEPAIALHVCNNLFGTIAIGYAGSALGTPTIWRATPAPVQDLVTMLVTFGVIWVVLTRVLKPTPSP